MSSGIWSRSIRFLTGQAHLEPIRLGNLGLLLRFRGVLRPYRGRYVLMCACLVAAAATALIQPVIYRGLVDDVLAGEGDRAGPGLLGLYILALALLRLGSILAGSFHQLASARVQHGATRDLEEQVHRKLSALPVRFHDGRTGGQLLPCLYSDPEIVIGALVGWIPSIVDLVIRGLVVLVIILGIFWWAGLLALAPLLPVIVLSLWNARYYKAYSDRFFTLRQSLYANVLDLLRGLRVVRLYDRTESERLRFRSLQGELLDLQLRGNARSAWFAPILSTVAKTGGILLFIVGSLAVLRSRQGGPVPFTLGTLFMLMSYVWQLASPITRLGSMAGRFGRIQAAAERLARLLDEPEQLPRAEGKGTESGPPGSLSFRDVTFGYDPARPVIQELSFTLAPGEVVGLAGPSGAGKTTIANLVCGFYRPEGGEIHLGGPVALVSQGSHLFQKSIRENLRFGRPDASDSELWEALETVEAAELVRRLPQGLDSLMGEGADDLSAGQKQRLALARGLLAQRPILILDEATSGIDLWSEQRIWTRLRRRMAGTTILLITHRLHAMRHADRVLVLAEGRLREAGTHQELSARGGYYASCLEMGDLEGKSPENHEIDLDPPES